MYKHTLRKVLLSALTALMIVSASPVVTFAQEKENTSIDSNLLEAELIEIDTDSEEIVVDDQHIEIEAEEVLEESNPKEFERDDEKEENNTIDKVHDDIQLKESNQKKETNNYYIKDEVLREIINEKLYKEAGHNPTPSELENITYLAIVPKSGSGFNSKNYLKIDTFEGFEYMVNLNQLVIQNIITDESAIEKIASNESLEYLTIEYSFFTGRNDVSTTLVNTSINGAPRENIELSFSSYVSFEPLSHLHRLKQIQIVKNGSIYDGTEFGKALTGYDLTGWENLSNLNYIWIEGASSFNDNSMAFIKYLPEINEITLYNTSLNTVENFADLREEDFRLLQLMSNDVLDYTPIIDKAFFPGSSLNDIKDILEFYTEKEINNESNKFISVNTGIKIGDNLDDVTVSSYSMFRNSMEYLGYENIDDTLYLNFKIKDLINFKYKSSDEIIHGFMVTVDLSYNTKRGITNVEFDLPVNIGKYVDFVLSDSDTERLYFKPFELINPIENPSRPGYEFIGWTVDEEGLTSFDFSKETYDNQIVYAQWQIRDTFTVTFNSNGGSEVSTLTNVDKDALIDEPEAPTRANYVFVGWFKDVDLTSQWDFLLDCIVEDTMLYAKWEPVSLGQMYHIEASDGTLNLSDLEDLNDSIELQAKIIEATQAKGFSTDHDGEQLELPVYVNNIDDILYGVNENYINVELTLIDPNKRLSSSSENINEANLTVKLVINDDVSTEEVPLDPNDNISSKPVKPEDIEESNKPVAPENSNTSSESVIEKEGSLIQNPSTGILDKNESYLMMIVIGLIAIVFLKKKESIDSKKQRK